MGEQTEQRRWAVTVSYTTQETYYVDADDSDEAEEKALDECGEYDAEVENCHQIAGPKSVAPALHAPPSATVTLLDGRVLTLPATAERGWFRVDGGDGDWWSNGWIAVRAESVAGCIREPLRPISISKILPENRTPGKLVAKQQMFSSESKEYRDLYAEGKEIPVRIDATYWPLVYDPATGLEPRIVGESDPVYGVRDGAIVAVVMPVRQ